ncbi:hypothetical protein [Acetobacter indonesiensis]|uniref:hypothetical protein n=1 Tax=Acetobacter indonesiensis TaxID=104101 RepID=UPI0039EA7AF9
MARSFPLAKIMLEAGSLLVFWVLASLFSLRVAIAGTLVFIIWDAVRRYRNGRSFPRLWIIINTLAILFGVIDLISISPFLLPYEAVLTNLITAVCFTVSAFGSTSLVQEIVEERQGFPFPPDRLELKAYFRAFTLVWAGYFVAKAGLYFWLLQHFPLTRALALRSVIGPLSLFIMIGISMQGKRVFLLCQRLGLFLSPKPLPHEA